MLERYALPPMRDLWSLEAQYQRWLRVELAALEALEELKIAPEGVSQRVRKAAHIDVEKILAVEREVGHDLVAFLWVLEEEIGPDGRWLHFGLTSSDVKDTALALVLRDALDILLQKAKGLGETLVRLAKEHKRTVMLGRTHGQWAELTTFGLKCLLWYDELRRVEERLRRAREAISVGKLSGAVGTYSFFPPNAEKIALEKLGLSPCPIASQVISRDRYAEVFFALSSAASLVEKIALEVRHLARSEVGEVAEGQPEGSSAMPHKRNPILSERLCGLARVVRATLTPAWEDNALWHERDMSHSSVERVLFPQAFVIVDYMLDRATRLLSGLQVYPERMRENVGRAKELYFSEALLLALVRAGLSRKEAHTFVAELSRCAEKAGKTLGEAAQEDPRVSQLGLDLSQIFQEEKMLANVEEIYRRVLGE